MPANVYKEERERAQAICRRLDVKPERAPTRPLHGLIPFFEAILDRLERQEKRLDDVVERLLSSLDKR